MKPIWKYIITASILLNIFLVCQLFKSEQVDRIPPWHPFELNSELTLESIVQDGYSFYASPCGQVQYAKESEDTYIQYGVQLNHQSHDGFYTGDLEPGAIEQTGKTWEEVRAENNYYPWNLDELKNYDQDISFRSFSKTLGAEIDSLVFLDYIESHDGVIMPSYENWNTQTGGGLMVNHTKSGIYFHCTLDNENYDLTKEPNWKLGIIRKIPKLN